MPEAQQQKHGLAGSIRSSRESETFDLGGMAAGTIANVIQHAFETPWELQEMIRITLVVGAGKQARQKYDLQALKIVTSTLGSLGFQEDRGASGVLECAGLYKVQHDTGKNLKTVVVFPKVAVTEQGRECNTNNTPSGGGLLPKDSMGYQIAVSSVGVFTNMVQSKCPSWSQKKALLHLIDTDIKTLIEECDQKLMTGQPLSAEQQFFYDTCTGLDEKQAHVKQALHLDVEEGHLTQSELDQLLSQVEQRVAELQKNSEGKKPPSALTKALERQAKLKKITPVNLPKLKHHAALGKLWKQIQPIMHLNENSSQLLSVQETKLLGQKLELLQQIEELEQSSRGWLEDEDVFDSRVQACRKEYQSKFKISSKTSGKNGSNNKGTYASITSSIKVRTTKWITPQENKASAMAKKKNKMKKGDVFGAMMAAVDDSDDDDDDDEQEQEATTATTANPSQPQPSKSSSSLNKKNKKRRNKNKNDEDAVFSELDAAQRKKQQEENKTKDFQGNGALGTVISILKTMLSIVVVVLTWLIGFLFGKSKKTKKN